MQVFKLLFRSYAVFFLTITLVPTLCGSTEQSGNLPSTLYVIQEPVEESSDGENADPEVWTLKCETRLPWIDGRDFRWKGNYVYRLVLGNMNQAINLLRRSSSAALISFCFCRGP